MMKSIRYILLSGMLLGILFACNMQQEPELDNPGEGKVLVSIQTTYTGTERSVFPDVSLEGVHHFALWGAPVGTNEGTLIPSFTQGASVALNAGTWNFTVKGYNEADALILQGELEYQEVSLLSNSFTFSLSPLLNGNGSIAITITLPVDSGVATATVFKDGIEEGGPLTPENDRITYSPAPVAAGDYFYTFRMNNSQGQTIAVVPEIVQVRASLQSKKTIELTPADLNTSPNTPAAPVIVAGDQQLTVSWDPVAMVGDYQVYYSATNNPPPTSGNSVRNTTTFVITGLTNGTTYDVWVKAENAVGTSGYSESASGTPLGTPLTPTVTPGDSQLTVSWIAVAGTSTYDVYYSESATPPSSMYQSDISGTSTTITGLSNGTTYYVWIKAKNSAGTSNFSPQASAKPLGTPGTLTVIIGNTQLTVSWTAVAGADSYEVYYSGSATPPSSAQQSNISSTSTTITNMINGTTYYVWIKAKNAMGTSDYSERASGIPLPPPTAPLTPTVAPGDRQLTVTWTAVVGADTYEVYYSGSATPPSSAQQSNISSTSTTITNLNNGTTYYVWIKAKNAMGTSDYSERASGIPFPPPVVPETPSVTIGNGQLTLTWNPVSGADSYEVYYSSSSTTPPNEPAGENVVINGTSAVISDLSNGTTYYVWIKAKNLAGTSDYSENVSGTPLGTGNASISIGFNYGQITIAGSNGTNAISKSGANGMPISLSLSANGYDNVFWYVDGDTTNKILDSGTGIIVSASSYSVQIHSITFIGSRNGALYSQEIPFTVFN
jgi:hypothetical protein